MEEEIQQYLRFHPLSSRSELMEGVNTKVSVATFKRLLAAMISAGSIEVIGQGPATCYKLTPQTFVTSYFDLESYFRKEVDEREIQQAFNFSLIPDILPNVDPFTMDERKHLTALQETFRRNVLEMTDGEYRKEMERLGVDLSWKSSQIEGNTYNLLETERLLLEKEEAKGKTKEEAIMLLNHKEALYFILDNPDYLQYLSIRKIEDIHSILIKELGVERHIRSRRVGITGTNYRPLDNEYQIREAMEDTCQLINNKQSIFDKAFLALVLLSYIQPFADGNKRTARITSNAILIANGYCPLSFRSVDSIDYKKAMLVFYEQNNIYPFKKIFIEQFEFAVNTYF